MNTQYHHDTVIFDEQRDILHKLAQHALEQTWKAMKPRKHYRPVLALECMERAQEAMDRLSEDQYHRWPGIVQMIESEINYQRTCLRDMS